MKRIFLLLVTTLLISEANSQTVQLSAPAMQGKQGKFYYFAGAKVDSLLSTIDASGKAVFTIPTGNYRGMAALVVSEAGGVELVVAEPTVVVQCKTNELNRETADFARSAENGFLKHIFTAQSQYMQQQAWLRGGEQFYAPLSPIRLTLSNELQQLNKKMAALDTEIATSKLYAAKYYRLADFMNRLFDTEQKKENDSALLIRKEMEEQLDIAALYTSGQLWGSALNFYASLFNHTVADNEKQQSVLKTVERLSDPAFEAFVASCITETERFGWQAAQQAIIEGILSKYKGFVPTMPTLQRALGAYRASTGKEMPPIVGLKQSKEVYTQMLVAFHDSDCSTCVNEMFRLRAFYPQLQEKSIRVVSIAADTNEEKFKKESTDFPWQDKLCDMKGFMGENFSNYNVIGSPSFYLIGKDGKLQGVFFNIADVEQKLSTEK